MLTFAIVEVEEILNSRLLTYVCTKKAVGTIPSSYGTSNISYFWNSWRKEYLSEHKERHRYSMKNICNKIKIAERDVALVQLSTKST